MKDEIKEILEDYKKLAGEITEKLDNTAEYESWLIVQDYFDKLLDYIINLQEENEKYKKMFEAKERFSKIMPEDTDFIILSKADYDRQQENIELTAIELKTRNEKAIEYINNLRDESAERQGFYNCFPDDLYIADIEELLEILKGKSDE